MAGRKSIFSVFFGSKTEANPVAQAAKAEDENEEPSVTGSKEYVFLHSICELKIWGTKLSFIFLKNNRIDS